MSRRVLFSACGFTVDPMSSEQGDRDAVEQHFAEAILALRAAAPSQPLRLDGPAIPIRENSALTTSLCLDLFDAQLASRHLDIAARWLHSRGSGFYTIGSSGHEGNAAVAAALRLDDPALLHYRSGAFYLVRAGQATPPRDGVRDVLLGLAAAAEEPIAGGRHKVFGHHALHVIPQTSTIASHLPRAVGVAFAIERAARLELTTRWPSDAIVVASFGDASLNHSSAVGALNTAGYCTAIGLGLPLLFVCEDNGLGISLPSPRSWVSEAARRPGIRYLAADGDRACRGPAGHPPGHRQAPCRAGAGQPRRRRAGGQGEPVPPHPGPHGGGGVVDELGGGPVGRPAVPPRRAPPIALTRAYEAIAAAKLRLDGG